MDESIYDALDRIIRICDQQLELKDGNAPAEAIEALSGIIDRCTMAQRAIRKKGKAG